MPRLLRLVLFYALIFGLELKGRPGWSQTVPALSVTLDSVTIRASRFLAGKVDSTDLLLAARAVVFGDSAKHRWLAHFSPIELRAEEEYAFFPHIRFFRFFTPDYKVVPGHAVAIDRQKGKAYLVYQSGAPDDLGELILSQGIKLDSEATALEYFLEILQIRGYQPSIILDTVSELRQFLHYRKKAADLKLTDLPPVQRLYRHLWRDRNFAPFKKGSLPAEEDSACRVLEGAWAEKLAQPFAYFQKGQFFIQLYLTRTRKIFEILKFSGYVSPEGLVDYSVKEIQ